MLIQEIAIQYYKTPYGELMLGAYQEALCLCDWRYRKMRACIDQRITQGLGAGFVNRDDVILKNTRQQLDEYFHHKRTVFDIPLLLVGTAFQESVWRALLQIPFGVTASYAELAQRIGKQKAIRAVGSANGANALSILVPCHRLIGSQGELVGYAGGLRVKGKLLDLEKSVFIDS